MNINIEKLLNIICNTSLLPHKRDFFRRGHLKKIIIKYYATHQ